MKTLKKHSMKFLDAYDQLVRLISALDSPSEDEGHIQAGLLRRCGRLGRCPTASAHGNLDRFVHINLGWP